MPREAEPPHEVIMPALGMAQDAGVIVAWLKQAGDKVAAGDPLMEVETDKATMEVEAQATGFLTDLRARAGDSVTVGHVVAMISASAAGGRPDSDGGNSGRSSTATEDADGAEIADVADVAEDAKRQDGRQVIMPALGMAQDTGLIVAWLKTPGDAVAADDVLLEVETDKSTMEVSAGHDGFLAAIHADAGEDVPVGEVIAIISASRPVAPQPKAATSGPRNRGNRITKTSDEKAGAGAETRLSSTTPGAAPTPTKTATSGDRILASPKFRKAASEAGLDLSRLVTAGVPQPYHMADLDRLQELHRATPQAQPPATAVAAPFHLSARVPAAALNAFIEWASAGSDAPPTDDSLLAAFAAASLRDALGDAAGGEIIIACGTTGSPVLRSDPDHAPLRDRSDEALARPPTGSDPASATPALILRDLRATHVTLARTGPDATPVLTLTRKGRHLCIALDCAADQIIADTALGLLTGFADRVADPLRHLL